jgi:hypothetical protein
MAQSGSRPDPESAITILEERDDTIAGEPVFDRITSSETIAPPNEPAIGSRPQHAGAIRPQRYDIRPKLGKAPLIEQREPHAIEADEPFLGADPEIAIRRARDAIHRKDRQPVARAPRVVDVLPDRLPRIERRGGRDSDRADQQR